MKKIWPWIVGIGIGLMIIALVFGGSSNRQDYWVARAAVAKAVEVARTEDLTLVRFPCGLRAGSVLTAHECGFYVWKK